jgi:transcriptional regulator with XRE-family HTH domain
MGYRGKVKEQEKARALRAQNRTLADIAQALGVSKSSVSLWVRDVPFTATLRLRGPHRRPHPARDAKLRQIEELNRVGVERLGQLGDQAFLVAGAALYAGEGSKTDGEVNFANSDPDVVRFFCAWLRRFFPIDETRLRVRVYLHEGLDLEAVERYWSRLTDVPLSRFRKSYRAVPDPSIRRNKHEYGCVYVRYTRTKTHRQIMGLVRALLSSSCYSGVAQSAAQLTVNETAEGSSPSPGAHTPPSSRTILPSDEKSSHP